MKQLWEGPKEVGYLGQEEEQEGLGEMAENTHHCKCHARKVAVGVADKDRSREPVVFQ